MLSLCGAELEEFAAGLVGVALVPDDREREEAQERERQDHAQQRKDRDALLDRPVLPKDCTTTTPTNASVSSMESLSACERLGDQEALAEERGSTSVQNRSAAPSPEHRWPCACLEIDGYISIPACHTPQHRRLVRFCLIGAGSRGPTGGWMHAAVRTQILPA